MQLDHAAEVRSDRRATRLMLQKEATKSISANESLIGCVPSMRLADWLASSSLQQACECDCALVSE